MTCNTDKNLLKIEHAYLILVSSDVPLFVCVSPMTGGGGFSRLCEHTHYHQVLSIADAMPMEIYCHEHQATISK